MTSQIINKVQKLVASLAIAGATVFTTAPTDGCNGEFEVLFDVIDLGDGSDLELDDSDWGSYDDESWYESADGLCDATPMPLP